MDSESSMQPASINDIKKQKLSVSSFVKRMAGDSHNLEPSPGSWRERKSANEYDDILPHFQGLSFKNHIQKLVAGSVWLDYGCGDAAVALQEIKKDNPGLICEGITYPVDREDLPVLRDVRVYREDGDDFLTHQVGRYNLITAVQSLRYSPDQLATIKRAYRALKENGVLLIDLVANASMPLIGKDGRMVDPQLLATQLKRMGYEVEIETKEEPNTKFASYSIGIRKLKGKPTLRLPVKLVKIPERALDLSKRFDTEFKNLGSQLPDINYVYQFDGN